MYKLQCFEVDWGKAGPLLFCWKGEITAPAVPTETTVTDVSNFVEEFSGQFKESKLLFPNDFTWYNK
jgi:hypothetical protein